MQRRRTTDAGPGALGCDPHHPPVSRNSPARNESTFGCAVQTRQFLFTVRFLFEVCWLLSFFSPGVPVQGELVRARGFRSRAFNSALARLAGCRARGGLPTRAPPMLPNLLVLIAELVRWTPGGSAPGRPSVLPKIVAGAFLQAAR